MSLPTRPERLLRRRSIPGPRLEALRTWEERESRSGDEWHNVMARFDTLAGRVVEGALQDFGPESYVFPRFDFPSRYDDAARFSLPTRPVRAGSSAGFRSPSCAISAASSLLADLLLDRTTCRGSSAGHRHAQELSGPVARVGADWLIFAKTGHSGERWSPDLWQRLPPGFEELVGHMRGSRNLHGWMHSCG